MMYTEILLSYVKDIGGKLAIIAQNHAVDVTDAVNYFIYKPLKLI